MNRTHKILGALLAAQAALAAITWSTCNSRPKETGAVPAFAFSKANVVSMEITSPDSEEGKPPKTIAFAKQKDKWVLASAEDYPADNKKVGELLDKLFELKIREPIANKAADHNALWVGEQKYDRKITVKTASDSKSIILGRGARSNAYLRYQGKDQVYQTVGFSIWAINNTARNYIDDKYLEVDKNKLTSVVITNEKGRLTFAKAGDAWALAELPPEATLDSGKAASFINSVSKLTLAEPIGKQIKPEYGLPGSTEVVLAAAEENGTVTITRYTIGAKQDDQHFYAKADDKEYVIAISKSDADQLREKDAAYFVKKAAEQK